MVNMQNTLLYKILNYALKELFYYTVILLKNENYVNAYLCNFGL